MDESVNLTNKKESLEVKGRRNAPFNLGRIGYAMNSKREKGIVFKVKENVLGMRYIFKGLFVKWFCVSLYELQA